MMPTYSHLLSPLKIGKFILKNRMQSSNSLPHFSQGPENYPADATMAHFIGRARNGAAFITFAGFEDSVDSPEFPDTLDMSHFPNFDLRDARCQNYMVELVVDLQSRIMDEYNEARLGTCMEVLCEGFDQNEGCYVGRTYADSVDIDGRVLFTAAGLIPAGEFVWVRITGTADGDLTGEIEE